MAVLIFLNLFVFIAMISLAIRHACRKCYYTRRNKRIVKERRQARQLKKQAAAGAGATPGDAGQKKKGIDTILEISNEEDESDDEEEEGGDSCKQADMSALSDLEKQRKATAMPPAIEEEKSVDG